MTDTQPAQVTPRRLLTAPVVTIAAIVVPGVIVGWMPRLLQSVVWLALAAANGASVAAAVQFARRRGWTPFLGTVAVLGAMATLGAVAWAGLTLIAAVG